MEPSATDTAARHPIELAFDAWFARCIGTPTPIQQRAWPVLRKGSDALLSAGTGQGKSLAAWRPLVERLLRAKPRSFGVRALHIAPLKSLARDMTYNLAPLLDFAGKLAGMPLSIALRCGDTPAAERAAQRRRPPSLLSTTPESLFVLLGSPSGRRLLAGVEAVVLDELHVLACGKRGAHLALSLARLEELCGRRPQRVGLSATPGSPETLARYLNAETCAVIEGPGSLPAEVRIELPACGLGAIAAWHSRAAAWDRIAALAAESRSMLLFCQTRGEVERSAAALDERLGALGLQGQVGVHHGSLERALREQVEARFRAGELRLLVSSASLELGLDLGTVDRVAQFGVPGSAALLCQRAGRANHRPGARALIHVFPLTLNQLIEAEALADCIASGRQEAPNPGEAVGPMDVLAQQLAAMIDQGQGDPEALLATARRAWPYRGLTLSRVRSLLEALWQAPEHLPAAQFPALLCRQGKRWRAAIGARRLLALNAGVIPDGFEYRVCCRASGEQIGRLDEEFAFECAPGQRIQLGHRSWRIHTVRPGEVLVEPDEQPATALPFWFGDGAGRSALVADAVRQRVARLEVHPEARRMLEQAQARLGALPGPARIVIERFLDPGGDRHVVLHTLAGARINRAWGLALRKRFCRQFNFELQAAATDDGILISLGVTSHFEPAEIVRFVRSAQLQDVLTQAVLDTPLFVTRFRWCAANALLLLRHDGAGAVPAQRQRNATENLITCVFPDQLACLENLAGPRRVPDHPLVRQALADCLHEHMDLDGLHALLQRIESGAVEVHAVDLEEPSPLAASLLQAPRHSFLDPAPAEERRTRAFEPRPAVRPVTFAAARPRVPQRPDPAPGLAHGPDALEALLERAGFLTAAEGERGLDMARPVPAAGWTRAFATLLIQRRALAVRIADGLPWCWMSLAGAAALAQRLPELTIQPWCSPGLIAASAWPDELPLLERIRRGRATLADGLGGPAARVLEALAARFGAAAPRGVGAPISVSNQISNPSAGAQATGSER